MVMVMVITDSRWMSALDMQTPMALGVTAPGSEHKLGYDKQRAIDGRQPNTESTRNTRVMQLSGWSDPVFVEVRRFAILECQYNNRRILLCDTL